jgi:hypothetical protein
LIAHVTKLDNAFSGAPQPDVGVPPAWPYETSGWDMKDVRLAYDYELDQLHIGINCWSVCGDADGDGDAGRTSTILEQRGGLDLPKMETSESFAVAFDVTGDGVMDFVLGYPSQFNAQSERYPCGIDKFDITCFGVYLYDTSGGAAVPSQRFIYKAASDVSSHPARDQNPATSSSRPDLEWTVLNFNRLRTAVGAPALNRTGSQSWSINFLAFGGSFQDDGVGEDQFPNNAPFERADFPCVALDACGVCGGDGSTCADCAGVPNGGKKYDKCGVCGGDDSLDCAGVPCGTSRLDVCAVCNGDGSTCKPPKGVCTEEFGNVCKFHAGDVWAGKYRDSQYDKLLAGDDVVFTFAPNNYVVETNRLGTTWNRFVITDNYLAVQEFTAFPDRVNRSCLVTDVAKYTLKFSADCRAAEIVAIIEPCNRREALYNDMRIELQPVPTTPPTQCVLHSGSGIWQAKYSERLNAWTGQHQVGTFSFAPQNRAVVESSDSAVYFYQWADAAVPGKPTQVRVLDRGSQDFAQACTIPDKGGLYTLKFSADCNTVVLAWPDQKIADPCKQRATRFDNLVLMRVPLPDEKNADSPCRAACAARLRNSQEVDSCVDRCEGKANINDDEDEHSVKQVGVNREYVQRAHRWTRPDVHGGDSSSSSDDGEESHYFELENPHRPDFKKH